MIRYKNEKFLDHSEINEKLNEIGLEAKDICSFLQGYYYLKGSVFCIVENITTPKTFAQVIDSIYKETSIETDYSKGVYNLSSKGWSEEYYIDGFITNYSHGNIDSNRYIFAFQPTDCCNVEGSLWPYKKHTDRYLILHDSEGFNKTFRTEFDIANTTQRLAIHKKFDVLKTGLSDDNEITLLEEISLDESLWYNNGHFNRCLVDELIEKKNSNNGFPKYYKFSDFKNKLSELNPEIIINEELITNEELLAFLKSNVTINKSILISMLDKFKKDSNLRFIPRFNELQEHTTNIGTIPPLIHEAGMEEIKTFKNRYIQFKDLRTTYDRELEKLSKKLKAN